MKCPACNKHDLDEASWCLECVAALQRELGDLKITVPMWQQEEGEWKGENTTLQARVAELEALVSSNPEPLFSQRELSKVIAQRDRYQKALVWALGAGEDFDPRPDGAGGYWWRPELQKRAGLKWDGRKFIPE